VRLAPLLHRGEDVVAAGVPVRARGAILVDARTGTVLWAKAAHRRLPIASTTKIMTALVALERLAPHDVVVIHPSVPRVAPFREGLRAGERVQAWKLLYGLLLYSGNDDALALAIGAAGSRGAFVHAMNVEARRLRLRDSHFRSPSGLLDVGNYSSAWDLAALTRYALRNPRFRAVVRTRVKHVPWAAPTYEKIYVNKNHLLGSYPGADGVKTGLDDAREALPRRVGDPPRRPPRRGRARLGRRLRRRARAARLGLRARLSRPVCQPVSDTSHAPSM
jgi:D-alanyl-D-alanine carboxypeptidase